jgi:hypothetical protein
MRRPHGVIENPAGTDRSPIASSGAICQVVVSWRDEEQRQCKPAPTQLLAERSGVEEVQQDKKNRRQAQRGGLHLEAEKKSCDKAGGRKHE